MSQLLYQTFVLLYFKIYLHFENIISSRGQIADNLNEKPNSGASESWLARVFLNTILISCMSPKCQNLLLLCLLINIQQFCFRRFLTYYPLFCTGCYSSPLPSSQQLYNNSDRNKEGSPPGEQDKGQFPYVQGGGSLHPLQFGSTWLGRINGLVSSFLDSLEQCGHTVCGR